MAHKVGFIGCGTMGTAMIKGVLAKGTYAPGDIVASDHTQATVDAASATLGIDTTTDNTVPAAADIVVLAIKPQVYEPVLAEVVSSLREGSVLVSIAPGKSIAWLAERVGERKIVRLMPNMPAAIGHGMTSVVFGDACDEADREAVMGIVNSFGHGEVIDEKLIDAASAVASCSPAYVYMFIEAMADAGVREGIPRASAYRFAAAAVEGAASMVLETGEHPAALKDAVCSPGGTTIEGLRVLEEHGMRSAVMEAIGAATAKATRL